MSSYSSYFKQLPAVSKFLLKKEMIAALCGCVCEGEGGGGEMGGFVSTSWKSMVTLVSEINL